MSSTEVILVGIDDSTESLAAVKWTANRGARTGARIHHLYTYALASYSTVALDGGYAVLDDGALEAGTEQIVREAETLVHERGVTHASGSAEPRDPVEVLISFSIKVSVIVVGSHGGGRFVDHLLGTISLTLPTHAKRPVVVAPYHTSNKKFTPVERVVVGIDSTDQLSCALKRVIGEVRPWDTRLIVVSTMPIMVSPSVIVWTPTGVDHSALLAQIHERADAAIAAALDGGDIHVSRRTLGDSAASLLIRFSTAVDLMVVGIHGRGRLAGILLGSTPQTALGHPAYPIMIIPPTRLGDAGAVMHTEWEHR